MLRHLSIQNYAIIDDLQVDFDAGVNIITGETGAGKSILLGALSLLLGERADSKVLYDQAQKCVIEAEFDSVSDTKALFKENDLDYETVTIIRREIAQSGKSRAFINDTPVNLTVLKALGEKLVNMHSQHETLDLVESGFQLEVLDALARNQNLLSDYRKAFAGYKKDHARLDAMIAEYNKAKAEADYVQFQLNELNEAKLETGEQATLETEQKTLENVESIKVAIQAAMQIIEQGEASAIDLLHEVQGQLRSVAKIHGGIAELNKRIETAIVELKDISAEFEDIQDKAALDPERLETVQQRLSVLYRLQKKYNVTDTEQLIGIQAALEQKVSSYGSSTEAIELLQKQLLQSEKELRTMAEKLHQNRQKAIPSFQKNVESNLHKVGMPSAAFHVGIEKSKNDTLSDTGLSEVKFLFSANKGFAPQEIKEVASGGELSRLMLSIKSQVAAADHLPTLIFDEIDTGISGEVALRVGEIMRTMSQGHQLICITHLPQIARIADRHLYIYKDVSKGKTHTRIRTLNQDERIQELAKMIGGEKVSEAALASAQELINTL
ncbi:MAG: DNA repair protein RecN [Bacteroidetes bacterium]|nr:DNA repair protein RecN [Bacteroidota bacterium]